MQDLKNEKTVYQLKDITEKHIEVSTQLQEHNVNPLLADLYALRGVENFTDVNLIQTLEPYTNLLNATEAAKILAVAILQKQKICVIADYDVDGATACAVAVRGLRMFGGNIDYVVPNRFVHGYGLTPSVVDEAITKKSPDLIVTVDNGISSVDGIAYAKQKGIEVLVTDHHLEGDSLPDALCIVNPNQKACTFKNKSLAGCGVMFYVLSALRQHMIDLGVYTEKTVPNIFSVIDLVAVGTIADVVKLDLNNRIIVNAGLNMIRKGKGKPGIMALIKESKKQYNKLTTMDIGFGLGPRLNAAGRLEDMSIGINCLLTDSPETAEKLAKQLNEININRRALEGEMKEEALDLPSLQTGEYSKVAFSKNFHEGVIGIVASRIKEQFYRPTIVFAPSDHEGLIKGSGRSIPEVHLRDALDYVYKKNPKIIAKFGGHAMAAGLTIYEEYLDDFCQLFEESVHYMTRGMELQNKKEIDLDLPAEFMTIENIEAINLEVWGQGFPQPLFTGNFYIVDQTILKETHLKLSLEKDGYTFDAIWFFNNEKFEVDNINVVYTLDVNEFAGRRKVQLMVQGCY